MSLSLKHQKFVAEYLVDKNATQAAIRAGYSERTARQQGARLLSKAVIADAIAEKAEKQVEKLEITAERILRELALIGFANMEDYVRIGADGDPWLDFSTLTREQAAAITEMTVEDFKDGRGEAARDVRRVKFKLADKRAALVDLGRHLALFTDKVQHGADPALTEAITKAMTPKKAAETFREELG
jgi:phage terminase small subunit